MKIKVFIKSCLSPGLSITLVALLGFAFGYLCARAPEQELLSQAEIQQMLNASEPNGPLDIDGKVGPITRAKWDRVICQREYEKSMRLMVK